MQLSIIQNRSLMLSKFGHIEYEIVLDHFNIPAVARNPMLLSININLHRTKSQWTLDNSYHYISKYEISRSNWNAFDSDQRTHLYSLIIISHSLMQVTRPVVHAVNIKHSTPTTSHNYYGHSLFVRNPDSVKC